MRWKHYQTVERPKREPQVGRGSVWYPPTNSSLQISIFQIHQIFNVSYFLQFNLSFEKKISFPKCGKITQKFTQNRHTLERERDIGRKAVLSDVETAFACTPP